MQHLTLAFSTFLFLIFSLQLQFPSAFHLAFVTNFVLRFTFQIFKLLQKQLAPYSRKFEMILETKYEMRYQKK
uniref:Uncharacterized protein n=1 Tax=Octopus bimaculoides TaxID=37653 RepID=A0A0L8HZ89_OCTBM